MNSSLDGRGESQGEGGAELSLQYPIYVLVRHKKKVVLCFAALFALVLLGALAQRPTYVSEAKLLVQVGRESVALDPSASTGRTVDLRRDRDQELRAELAILRSPDLARQVVQSIGAEAILRPGRVQPADPSEYVPGEDDEAEPESSFSLFGWLRSLLPGDEGPQLDEEDEAFFVVYDGLDIDLVDDSSVLKLSYEGSHARLSQQLLETLIERFGERHLEVHRTPGSYEFFKQQTEHFAAELDRAEQELRKARQETGFASSDVLRAALLERLSRVHTDLGETEASIGSLTATSQALREILDELPETVVLSEREADTNPTAEYLERRVGELRIEEQDLAQNYADDSRRLRAVREQIRVATELMNAAGGGTSEVTRGLNATRLELELSLLQDETRLKALEARRDVLFVQQNRLTGELAALNASELTMTRLEREIEGLEQNWRRYSESFEEARVGQALEMEKISNIRVIQPPTLPLEPSGRGRSFTLLLGTLLSAAAALGLAFVAEQLDRSIKTPEDLARRLGLRTLIAIPYRRLYRWKTAARAIGDNLSRGKQPSPPEFLELSDLLMNLDRSAEPRGRVIGLTASRHGEGVSTLSAHLAATLAEHADGAVLLVDAELGRPAIHRQLGVELSPGIAEYLEDPVELPLQKGALENLHVLTAGRGGYPQQMLKRGRFEALLNRWRQEYTYVVVDLPALSEPSSATRLATLCDRVLLVVAAESHPWKVADRSREQLLRSDAKLLGAVLNKQRFTGSA